MQIWNFANPLDSCFWKPFFKKVLVPLTVKNFLCYLRLKFLTNLACLKVLLNPKWVFDDSDRAKKVS